MQLRLLLLLLSPSWLSFATVFVAAGLLIGEANWAYFTYNPGIFDFFYGPRGVVTTLEQAPNALASIQHGVAENPLFYGVGLIVVALVAAVVIFLFVRSVERGIGALTHMRHEAAESRHEAYSRALLRLAILALWVIYTAFSVAAAIPFCLLLSRIGAEDITTMPGLATSLFAAALLVLTFHAHVIFARMFCLRPRVYGGEAAIQAATLGKTKSIQLK